jgi:hypothetical protein
LNLAIIVAIGSHSHDVSRDPFLAWKPGLELISLFGTTFFTGLGGYIARRLTPTNSFINSLSFGVINVLLGIVFFISLHSHDTVMPGWKAFLGFVLTIPAALLGGYLAAPSPKFG